MKSKSDYSKKIQYYLEKLFPINRSLTGPGNRKTLKIIQEIIPIKIKEIKSGTKVYDWHVPKEWIVKNAWIMDMNGNKLVDFKDNNLHLYGYSHRINKIINWETLKKHLHTNYKKNQSIEYRTSYYKKTWGFSVTYNQYKKIRKNKGNYRVFIDSSFKKGSLSFGEMLIKGRSKKEILISTYICHPSMANDNLSGVICTSFLAREISKIKNLKWSYRIVFIPETIGAIAYSCLNEKKVKKIDYALVISNVGGPGKFGYKQSFQKNSYINKEVENILESSNLKFITYPFDISGSDERQYSTQGFQINSVTITKDKYYEYEEYHTSKDNLDFVNGEQINKSLNLYLKLIKSIEKWKIYKSRFTHGELMLSKRNLYNSIGGGYLPNINMSLSDLMLWIIFLSNGKTPIQEISNRTKVEIGKVEKASKLLLNKKIIYEI